MQTVAEISTTTPKLLNIWQDAMARPASATRARSVDKCEGLSRREFLHEYVLKGRPVILKDAAREWAALSKWTPTFFREKYGSKQVPVFERKRAVTMKAMVRMEEYIDEILAPSSQAHAKYLFSLRIAKEFPELLGDLEPRPSYWDPNWLDSKFLLPGMSRFKLRNITGLEMNIGGPGSVFPFLHYDDLLTQTFITQVHGRKEWIMYEPSDTPFMYPSEEGGNISQVPMEEDVDLEKFPLYSQATPIRFILEEGEMLYGAPGWWHVTRALTRSIAVVLSTANGPIWSKVTKAAFLRARQHPKWHFRLAALPIAAYMTGFRAVKSLTDPF